MTDGPRLHPLLATRSSPTAFDATSEVADEVVDVLLEAARWAPSAGSSQPWAFIVGRRGAAIHQRLVPYLARSSSRWAPTADVLFVNLSHRYVEGTDWEFSEFSLYDLGQAVAHMTFQAQALGLAVRQFRAFDQQGLAAEFAVPGHWQVTTMSAVGRPARTARPEEEPSTDEPGRSRRTRQEILWPGA